jgi:hypothetical protein
MIWTFGTSKISGEAHGIEETRSRIASCAEGMAIIWVFLGAICRQVELDSLKRFAWDDHFVSYETKSAFARPICW